MTLPAPTRYRAFVALGGNLGDRLATLQSAARALATTLDRTTVQASSHIYETRPVGPSTQPFLNAVLVVHTPLRPAPLLAALLGLESNHGRERRRRWDARTLDLDLLLAQPIAPDGSVGPPMRTQGEVTLPHPEIVRRDFVLRPLCDLAGDEPLLDDHTPRWWLDRVPPAQRTIVRQRSEPLLPREAVD